MKNKFILSFSFLLAALFSFSSTALNATTSAHDPVGTYDFTVTDIPDMPDVKGVMVVSRENGVVTVSLKSDTDSINLDKVVLAGHKLTGQFNYQGMLLKLEGTFKGNNFEGQFNTEFGPLTVTAEKQ